MASCNPDSESWVLNWIEWWLDAEGYPDPNKRGKIRYYVVVDDKPRFADTQEELIEQYPEACQIENPNTGEIIEVPPKSITFIGGTIFDNPILIQKNPKYLAELKALNRVEKARLLDGNWYVKPEGSGFFVREWLEEVDSVPYKTTKCRAWDKAGSIPSETYPSPDFTASIKFEKDADGILYLCGDFIEELKDKGTDIYGKFRRRPGEREQLILKQAQEDGEQCHIILAKDSGQAGQTEYFESSKKLMQEGFIVKPDPIANNKSKVVKFQPFCAAAQNGMVRIVPSTFPNKATMDAVLTELEKFDGERSTSTKKDDWVDCCSTGFNYIVRQKNYRTPIRNQNTAYTAAKDVLDVLNNNS